MSFTHKQDHIFIDISEDVLRATDVLTQKGPVKQMRGDSDLLHWVRSQAYRDLIAYINNTSIALQGYRQTGSFPVSEVMHKLCDMFDVLERPLAQYMTKHSMSPPGKKSGSYRAWLRHMFQKVLNQLAGAISAEKCKHIHELGEYLRRSFGNAITHEFGPGNELMFLFFLCGLFRANILQGRDTVAAVLMLFYRYINLVRRLIVIYALPMASKPRCALEDYFFVAYIWGAAQLCLDAPFTPLQCDQPKEIESYRQDYMMVNLIENLPGKGEPLSQSAFQLWCILSVPKWPDVYRGLERCYINHILASFHTVENAIFSELMSFDVVAPDELLHRAVMGQRYKSSNEEKLVSGSEQQSTEFFEPVRTYDSLSLFAGFKDERKELEEELDDNDDRLAMPHPTVVNPAFSETLSMDIGYSDASNSNSSEETNPFEKMQLNK